MKLLALVLLAGCGMIQTSSGGSTTPTGPAPSGGGGATSAPTQAQANPPASDPPPSGPVAPSDNIDHFHGMLVRHQLEPLRGMTVEAGKAELARLGYHGAIQIDHPYQFIDKCGLGKICSTEPQDGLSLTDPTAVMHFTVNADAVKISTPDQ